MNYNTYIDISITYNKVGTYEHCRMYISVASANLEMHTNLSRKEARHQMAKLALRMGCQPKREVNSFNPNIITLTLSGFLE